MDEKTLRNICSNNELLSEYFAGIETWRNIPASNIQLHKIGSFVIINFENSHWFAIQKIKWNKMLIFDSFGGEFIPSKKSLAKASSHLSSPHAKSISLDFVVSKSRSLQTINALTCGEHVINFLLYSCKMMKKLGQIKNNYASKLLQLVKKLKISSDIYVWNEIYNIMQLAPKPNLNKVCGWYENIMKF